MRRVLMISPHFPPDSTAGTHRVRLLAPHMHAFGWEPTVLTIDPRDYEGRLDPMLAASVPDHVRVVRVRAWPAGATRRLGVGDLGLRAFAGLRREARRLLSSERFDAVFVTIYPTYPALLGASLKRRYGVPFVLDYQDPWVGEWGRTVGAGPDSTPDVKSRASRLVAERLEPLALRAADAVTAVSRMTFDQALSRVDGARPAVTEELPIGWDPADFEFLRGRQASAPRWPADDALHLVSVGTLLPAGLETLRAFCEALRLQRRTTTEVRLRVHFFGTSNQRGAGAAERVMPIARECGVADCVSEHPERLDYFDALDVLDQSSGVLLLGSREPHYTPSKVYPALASRKPIVAVLHAASSATDLLKRTGHAPSIRLVTYDDGHRAAARADALARLLADFCRAPVFDAAAVDWAALEAASAHTLAARLAEVLDRTARTAA